MKVEVLTPTCNPQTITDGRGGIFTWIPREPLVEFNLLHFRPGAVRGLHYHEHFVEYLLVVSGDGALVTRDSPNATAESDEIIHLSRGTCTRTPIGVPHTVYAITELVIVAMLTRRWDESHPPVVRLNEVRG